jgi:hypothetical protein
VSLRRGTCFFLPQVDALIAKFTNTVSDTEGLMVRYPYNVGLQDL